MSRTLCVTLAAVCFALTGAVAQATVTVYPDPVQFGTVPVSSYGNTIPVSVNNSSATAVTISAITISGTNSAQFALGSWTCVGVIAGYQACQMYVTFTPSAMGNISASLMVAVNGVTTPITIPMQGTGGNPIPNLTSVSPASIYVNSPTTTVTLNGSGFLSSSVVYSQYLNNGPLPTTYVSATKLTAQLPDTSLSNLGEVDLYVVNPQPGGGNSDMATLQIIGGDPSIGGLNPASIVAGTTSEPILINGDNFASGATVQWNGVNVPSTYISPSQLQVQPTTTELASPGINQITVTNPSPGTVSQYANFDVTAPVTITILDLLANNLVWDPFAQVIYASLPSTYGVNGNSIAVINPTTGTITGYHYAGSEPDALALDSNSKYLYVGLDGNNSVQRLDLPGFTTDVNISLGKSANGNVPPIAQAIAVDPANAQTIAVQAGSSACYGCGTLDFFTGTTKLTNSSISASINQLVFANGTTLYGYDSGSLSQVNVTTSGGTLGQTWSDIVNGASISYSGGLIFGGNGQEFNPSTGLLLGTFDTGNNSCCNGYGTEILSNAAIKRAFALGQTPFFNSLGITSYNLSQFTPVAVANLSELSGQYGSSVASNFIQWSTNGMAFILAPNACCSTSAQVVLVQSPMLMLTLTKTASPVPVANSLSPAMVSHGSGNFRMSVRGSGFVPGSIVTWNGKRVSASYVSPTQMTVYVTKATITSAGTAAIAVKNPAPGGGASSNVTLTIN